MNRRRERKCKQRVTFWDSWTREQVQVEADRVSEKLKYDVKVVRCEEHDGWHIVHTGGRGLSESDRTKIFREYGPFGIMLRD